MIKDIIENNNNKTINEDKISNLKQIIPNCFDKDGRLDLELLKKEFNTDLEFSKESFELNFLGKSYAKMITGLDTETVIEPDLGHNNKEENINSENIYISGDNIDALKHLVKAYEGKIKCIYIDPPYNTGKDGFGYNDTFKFSKETLANKLDIDMIEAERILDMTSNNSSSHSAWLTFMYPRLYLAKQLLSEYGAIFISIDDNEVYNLKQLCDQIFGEENFVSQITWQCLDTIKNDAKYFSDNDEYILCYAKNKEKLRIKGIKKTEKQKAYYKNYDNDPRGDYLLTPLHAKSGVENSIYTYVFKNGQRWTPIEGTYPRFSKDTLSKLEEDNRIYLDPEGINVPQKKTFWSEVGDRMPSTTFWGYEEYGSTRQSNKEISELLGKGIFKNSKPTKLIKNIIDLICEENDIIVDFFSGSGTTLHAVNLLNAEDNGQRRCVMVTNNEVSEAEITSLTKQGLHPGDEEWENFGIARYITWPRTVCTIEGHDTNGAPLKGDYLGIDRPMANGFPANAAFFKLRFLDKTSVALGRQFRELLPVLWMKSGAVGKCPVLENDNLPNMLILPQNKMAVLVDEIYYSEFDAELSQHPEIQTVFIVTDSEIAYRSMIRAYDGKDCYQLYRDYLDNFRINTGR